MVELRGRGVELRLLGGDGVGGILAPLGDQSIDRLLQRGVVAAVLIVVDADLERGHLNLRSFDLLRCNKG